MKISNSIILVICLLLIGCGSDKEEKVKVKPDTESKAEPEAKENQQTKILAPHLKTLNQAKDMEKTLKNAETARKMKMDEQEETTETGNPD